MNRHIISRWRRVAAWSRIGLVPAILAGSAASAAPADDSPPDPPFVVLKVDGSSVTGRLRAIGPDGGVSLAVDDRDAPELVPAGAFVKLSRAGVSPSLATPMGSGSARGVVLFPGGDRIARAEIGVAGETAVEVRSPTLGKLSIPTDRLLGLVFTTPLDSEAARLLVASVRDDPRSGELLWLGNGDRLAGGLLGLDARSVKFRPTTAAGPADYDRSGVVALGFDPSLVDYPKPDRPFLDLSLADGTRLGVVGARIEAGQVRGTSRFGASIALPVGDLASARARGGPAIYLSERTPAVEKTVGYIAAGRPSRVGSAIDGGPLRLGGRSYDDGLGTQSRSYLAYKLDPGVKRFQALVGLDDRAGPLGSVVFRVLVNGQEKYASPPMSSRDAPRAIDVDLAGARNLVLVTDFGERGGVRDHADWVEARLIR